MSLSGSESNSSPSPSDLFPRNDREIERVREKLDAPETGLSSGVAEKRLERGDLNATGGGESLVLVKGAPEVLPGMCGKGLAAEGSSRESREQRNKALTGRGLRVRAMAFEPVGRALFVRPPRPPEEGVLNRNLFERLALAGIWLSVGVVAVFLWARGFDFQSGQGDSVRLTIARTAALTTLVLFQKVHVFNM